MPGDNSRPHLDSPEGESRPWIRLRTVLALCLFASVSTWVVPRGRATWHLHNQAVVYADYALCMVGPTGPELLRDDPLAFKELVRRRLVAAPPESKPLSSCLKFVEQMPISHTALRLHSRPAVEFFEYHNAPGVEGTASLEQLELPIEALEEVAESAWPFVRSGASVLMKPSSHTREATHPPRPAEPGKGTGLPAKRTSYRSTAAYGDTVVAALGSGANASILLSKNGGVDWRSGGRALAGEIRDRCVADEEGRAFTLTRMNDGQRIVVSQGPSAAPQLAKLATGEEKLAGISCDSSALVAALVLAPDETGHRPVRLRVCPFRRPCRDLNTPEMGGSKLYYPMDVARIGGDIVVARTAGGITRVASSRDEGRSWTPWTVAYDALLTPWASAAPYRLLVAADTLLLYTGSRAGEAYPLLQSSDHGASFQTPRTQASSESETSPERQARAELPAP